MISKDGKKISDILNNYQFKINGSVVYTREREGKKETSPSWVIAKLQFIKEIRDKKIIGVFVLKIGRYVTTYICKDIWIRFVLVR